MARASKRSNELRLKQVENALDAHRKDMYGEGKQAAHPEDAQKFMMEIMSNMETSRARFEAVTGQQISVGRPYFDRVSVPLSLLLLLTMATGPLLAWHSPTGRAQMPRTAQMSRTSSPRRTTGHDQLTPR